MHAVNEVFTIIWNILREKLIHLIIFYFPKSEKLVGSCKFSETLKFLSLIWNETFSKICLSEFLESLDKKWWIFVTHTESNILFSVTDTWATLSLS